MFFFSFFFFSSRRRHTRCSRDWSSDVCSSDLPGSPFAETHRNEQVPVHLLQDVAAHNPAVSHPVLDVERRSEERRVGKECRSRWSRCHEKKKRDVKAGEEAVSHRSIKS